MCLIYNKNTTPAGGWKADRDIVCYKILKKIFTETGLVQSLIGSCGKRGKQKRVQSL